MKIQLALLALLGLTAARDHLYYRLQAGEQTPNNFVEATFTQTLDHFTPADKRTYTQRYFYNDTFFDAAKGPVFLFICGEGRCNPPTSRGYPMQVCQELKCLFYVLEHRFYGDSQPMPDWSVASLQYLTAE